MLDEDEDEIFKKYGGGGGSSKPTKKPSSRNLKDLRRGNRTSPVSPLPARPLQPPSLSLNSSSSETLPQHQRKKEARPARHPRVFISDFGLCKKLADDQSSFHHTVNLAGNGGGTVGWRAPEILAGLNDLKDAAAKEEQERELEKERLILLQNKKHQQRGRTASSGSGSSTSSAKSGRIPVVVPAAAARGVDVDYRLPERDDEGREEEEGGEEEEEEEDTAANRDSAGGLKVPLAVGDGTSETYTLLSPNNPTLKVTKKIDIFAAGCVFYYILSGGEHPFGDRYMREMNIVKGNFKVEKCSSGGENDLDEEISESKDLIKRMIAKDPKKR